MVRDTEGWSQELAKKAMAPILRATDSWPPQAAKVFPASPMGFMVLVGRGVDLPTRETGDPVLRVWDDTSHCSFQSNQQIHKPRDSQSQPLHCRAVGIPSRQGGPFKRTQSKTHSFSREVGGSLLAFSTVALTRNSAWCFLSFPFFFFFLIFIHSS